MYFHSPERRLLLACASTIVPDYRRIRALLNQRSDWQRIAALAEQYSLAPLLYANLKKLRLDRGIEPSVMDRLRRLYRQSHAAGMKRLITLKEILALFSREEIPVILLKGAALAPTLYDSVGLRPMLDLDFLVKVSDLNIADQLLRDLGYTIDESYQTSKWYKAQHHHLAPYIAPDGTVIVELHHQIVSSRSETQISLEDLWQRARSIEIAGQPALVLSPQDLLESVCTHVALSQCFGSVLRDIVDIAEIVRKYKSAIDWDTLVRDSTEHQTARALYYCLWVSKFLFGSPIASHVLQEFRSAAKVTSLRDRCLKFLILRAVFGDSRIAPLWIFCGLINAVWYPKRRGDFAALVWGRVLGRFASSITPKQTNESVTRV